MKSQPYIPYLIPVSIKGVVIEDNKVWLRKTKETNGKYLEEK